MKRQQGAHRWAPCWSRRKEGVRVTFGWDGVPMHCEAHGFAHQETPQVLPEPQELPAEKLELLLLPPPTPNRESALRT